MKKSTRMEKAHETVAIIEGGSYVTSRQEEVNVKESIQSSIANSKLYRTSDFDEVLSAADKKIASSNYQTTIQVVNKPVLTAAELLAATKGHIGCLNFASAKNPGGGFLGGAIAQEESLAMSTSLYGSLMANFEMYEYNRSRQTLLYSDYMIWSPEVVVFRNDNGSLLPVPYRMSIVTSPAANVGAILNNRPYEMEQVSAVMLQRMDKVLALMLTHGVEHLLLGAWGCGVFRNDPVDVAGYFAAYLMPEAKYGKAFKSVTFAVLDRQEDGRNITAFKEAFAL